MTNKVVEWEDRTNFDIELQNRYKANPFDLALAPFFKKPRKILEIGCGQGRFMSIFPNITGLEYSQKFIDIAKKRGVKGKIYKGDAFNMPFKSKTFDLSFSTGLIEHYDDKQKLVNEHARVVKDGGLCIITVPSAGPDAYVGGLIREVVYKNTEKYDPQYFGERMHKKELHNLMQNAGLKNIKVYNIGLPLRGQPVLILKNIRKSNSKLLAIYAFFLHSIAFVTTTNSFRRVTGDLLVRLFSRKFGHSLIAIGTKWKGRYSFGYHNFR